MTHTQIVQTHLRALLAGHDDLGRRMSPSITPDVRPQVGAAQ